MALPARGRVLGLGLALLVAAGCSHAPRPDAAPGSRLEETGVASFYGREFEGRRTASGERYRATELTAAHRTLPFGTVLRVTHLRSGRSVEVRVNDRGPHRKGRIVDLSRRAAEALGMIGPGLARVRIEVLALP